MLNLKLGTKEFPVLFEQNSSPFRGKLQSFPKKTHFFFGKESGVSYGKAMRIRESPDNSRIVVFQLDRLVDRAEFASLAKPPGHGQAD